MNEIRNGESQGGDVMAMARGWVKQEDEIGFLRRERKREKREMSF